MVYRYIRKALEVEAILFMGDPNLQECLDWMNVNGKPAGGDDNSIHSMDGMLVRKGDMVVKEVNGEILCMPLELFEKNYTLIPPGTDQDLDGLERQLVSFGHYLLSKERTDRIASLLSEGDSLEFRLQSVYDADLANWKESLKGQTNP